MVKAMAAHKSMADKVDLQVQVAGPNAQRQIQQINAMVQAGRRGDRRLPDLAHRAEPGGQERLRQGRAWSSPMTATSPSPAPTTSRSTRKRPAASRPNGWSRSSAARATSSCITGVPGTSVDTLRTEAAKEVFAKHPDIKIVAEAVGMWSQAVARTELSKILATRSWDEIDGLWMQVGCYTANAMQLEAGKTPEQLLPCAGEGVERRPHPDAAGRHRGRRRQRAPTRRWARRASPTPRRPTPARSR